MKLVATGEVPGQPLPVVRPETILWDGGIGTRMLVCEFTLENPYEVPTRETLAALSIAEFGAFLPYVGLSGERVPTLPPGASRRIELHLLSETAERSAREPDPLGASDSTRGEARDDRGRRFAADPYATPPPSERVDVPTRVLEVGPGGSIMLTAHTNRLASAASRLAAAVALDAAQPIGSAFPGSVVVTLDGALVAERNRSQLYAPRRAAPCFAVAFVHASRPEHVALRVREGSPASWGVELLLAQGPGQLLVEQGCWYPVAGTALLGLRVTPPRGAGADGEVVIDVLRRSDRRIATLEFRFVLPADSALLL